MNDEYVEQYDDNYQPQPYPKPNFIYQNPMTKYAGSIEILTDPSEDLFKLELALRSIKMNKNGTYIQLDEPLINETGIVRLMGISQGLINQITILSNYEDKNIKNIMLSFNRILVNTLVKNRITFEIRKPYENTRSIIQMMFLQMGLATIHRAKEQGEKRFWQGSQQDLKQTIISNSNENKGIFSRFFKGGN